MIHVTFEIEKLDKVLIKRINLSLVQLVRVGEETSASQIFEITLSNIINLKRELIKQTFSLVIPSDSNSSSYRFHISTMIYISYMIKFEFGIGFKNGKIPFNRIGIF